MACRRQGLKVFFSLQEPPPGLIWVQSTEDYWLHMVGQTKHRRAHWQWICAQVFNSETNLQIPSDLRKPDAWQSGKKNRDHHATRTALLVTFSSPRIFQFRTVRGYRVWLKPDTTEASFFLTTTQKHQAPSALDPPSSSVKYTYTLKICSALTLMFYNSTDLFTTPSWVYLLLVQHLVHFLDRSKLEIRVEVVTSFY